MSESSSTLGASSRVVQSKEGVYSSLQSSGDF